MPRYRTNPVESLWSRWMEVQHWPFLMRKFPVLAHLLGPIHTKRKWERKREKSKNKQKRSNNKQQTSKKMLAFAFAFARSEHSLERILKFSLSHAVF